jgi:4-amino-4-deoxy-L-arabinose transferase-like glycosyltransferase
VLIILIAAYNQPYYPTAWLDEGFALQGAMNLAKYGQYAMRSVEGFRVFDQPLIANGPGVVLPISAAFKLFGIGLLQARLVMVIFFVITSYVYFRLARRLNGILAACISLFLLLALPEEGFILYGRHALGMIPSLLYFLIGYFFWLNALQHNRLTDAAGAGLFFGLAMITKGQYLLLIPMFFVVLLIDWIYDKFSLLKRTLIVFLAMAIVLAFWYGVQLMVLKPEGFLQSLEAIQSSSKVTISAFRISRIPGNIGYLTRSGILLVVIPGWLYVGWLCLQRDVYCVQQLLLLVFVPFWLAWFAFVSVGFYRYSLDPYIIGALFTGRFIADVYYSLRSKTSPLPRFNRLWFWLVIPVSCLIILFGVWVFKGQIQRIVAEPSIAPQKFAAYLEETIDSQEVVESWEWELDVLAPGLTYHHPTNIWVDRMHLPTQFGIPVEEIYDPAPFKPAYLIDGPFSKWTGLYAHYLSAGCCSLVKRVGPYDLYQVNQQVGFWQAVDNISQVNYRELQ